jgi:tetratricopeptide (TPR) repeat protein
VDLNRDSRRPSSRELGRRQGGVKEHCPFRPGTQLGELLRRQYAERHAARFAPELWDAARPLYAAGNYTEAADKGRELIEARPDQPYLYFNTACCESLAGRTADAINHLRQAIEMWEGCRDMARHDSDFEAIRDEPDFQEFVGG